MLGDKDEEKKYGLQEKDTKEMQVYITQNLFQQSQYSRTISLNVHNLVVYQSPRDKMQFKVLAN